MANASTTDAQREVAELLMAAVGLGHWVADEELLHAVPPFPAAARPMSFI